MRRAASAVVLSSSLLGGILCGMPPGCTAEPATSGIVGDAIPRSLTGGPGDAIRGRDIAMSRERGNCAICHVIPGPDARSHGDVGPSLAGVADRLSEGQMRLRLVDGRRLNPSSIMPSYHRVDGMKRVAAAYAGKPVLTAEEIEDLIAFLATLRKDTGTR